MLNVKLCSQSHISNQVKHLRWSCFTSVKPYFKNVLSSIELPLGSIFYNSPFREKSYNCENWEKNSFVNNNRAVFFFEIRNYVIEWRHQ